MMFTGIVSYDINMGDNLVRLVIGAHFMLHFFWHLLPAANKSDINEDSYPAKKINIIYDKMFH